MLTFPTPGQPFMDLVSGVCSRYFRREFLVGRLVIQPVLLFAHPPTQCSWDSKSVLEIKEGRRHGVSLGSTSAVVTRPRPEIQV